MKDDNHVVKATNRGASFIASTNPEASSSILLRESFVPVTRIYVCNSLYLFVQSRNRNCRVVVKIGKGGRIFEQLTFSLHDLVFAKYLGINKAASDREILTLST
jgi:hypothetical protein